MSDFEIKTQPINDHEPSFPGLFPGEMTKGQIASVCIKKDAELSVILVKILLSDLIPEKFAILELSKKDIQTLHQAVLDSQI